MGLFEIVDLMSSKSGDELFLKVADILKQFGIAVTNYDGEIKDLRTLCGEVVEVWNREK